MINPTIAATCDWATKYHSSNLWLCKQTKKQAHCSKIEQHNCVKKRSIGSPFFLSVKDTIFCTIFILGMAQSNLFCLIGMKLFRGEQFQGDKLLHLNKFSPSIPMKNQRGTPPPVECGVYPNVCYTGERKKKHIMALKQKEMIKQCSMQAIISR